MSDLAPLALAALLALSPPARHRPPPGWQETPEAARARYEAIAADIGAMARNASEVAYLVGIAVHESGLYADVDAGRCYRGPGWESRCDAGRAVSIWQLQDADPQRRERWRTDRRAAAREALRRIAGSVRRCGHLGHELALSGYASGRCWAVGPVARVARSLWEHVQRARRAMSNPHLADRRTNSG